MMSATAMMSSFRFDGDQVQALSVVLNPAGLHVLEDGIDAYLKALEPAPSPPVPDPAREARRLANLTDAVRKVFGPNTEVRTPPSVPGTRTPPARTPAQLRDQLNAAAHAVEAAVAAVRALPPQTAFPPDVGYGLTNFSWNGQELDGSRWSGSVGTWARESASLASELRSGARDIDVGPGTGKDPAVQALNRAIGLAVFVSTRDVAHGALMKVLEVLQDHGPDVPRNARRRLRREPDRALVENIWDAVRDISLGPALCGDHPVGTPLHRVAPALVSQGGE